MVVYMNIVIEHRTCVNGSDTTNRLVYKWLVQYHFKCQYHIVVLLQIHFDWHIVLICELCDLILIQWQSAHLLLWTNRNSISSASGRLAWLGNTIRSVSLRNSNNGITCWLHFFFSSLRLLLPRMWGVSVMWVYNVKNWNWYTYWHRFS